MKFGDINMRKSNKYCWRPGNPKIDIDFHGKPVESNYFTILEKKKCPIVEEDGQHFYLADKDLEQAEVLAYGGTYYGYGKSVKKIIDSISYRVTPIYYAGKNGVIYIGAIKNKTED